MSSPNQSYSHKLVKKSLGNQEKVRNLLEIYLLCLCIPLFSPHPYMSLPSFCQHQTKWWSGTYFSLWVILEPEDISDIRNLVMFVFFPHGLCDSFYSLFYRCPLGSGQCGQKHHAFQGVARALTKQIWKTCFLQPFFFQFSLWARPREKRINIGFWVLLVHWVLMTW